jgi:AraC-like DNA-binding protein
MLSSSVTTFTDPYEHQQAILTGPVELFVTQRGRYTGQLTRVELDCLRIHRNREPLALVAHAVTDDDRIPIFFLTDSQQSAYFHSGLELLPGDIIFYAKSSEYYRRSFSEARWGAMSLPVEELAVAAEAVVGRELTAPASNRLIRPPPALMTRLLRLHEAAGQLAETAPDILAHPEVARVIKQELLRVMVACLTDPAAVERRGPSQQAVIRRFEQILEARRNEPLYMTEVCAAIGVSERTLRQRCQEHLRMNPHRYLWLRRMHQARRALTVADAETKTVTEIATEHGFWELGRFAVAYRELFGETPSATLRQLRIGPEPGHVEQRP